MVIDFARSAARHGIGRERIRYVVEHCPAPLYPPADDPDTGDLVLFLGPDGGGVPLEIVAIEREGGALLVIHAVRMRRSYAEAFRWVMSGS